TCWAFNALASIQAGDDITIDNVKFVRNPGSNDTEFGTNTLPATVTRLKKVNGVHQSPNLNPATADFSADFFIALGVTLTGNHYQDGPTSNGSAYEIHGSAIAFSDNVVNNYFNGSIIANEVLSPSNNNITGTNNTFINVVYGGIQLAARPSSFN